MSGGGGTKTQQTFSPEEQARRNQVQSEAGNIYNATKGSYATSGPVPFSPETLEAQQRLLNYSTGAGTNLATQAGNAASFGLGPVLYPGSNPALQATMDTAVRKVGQAYTDPNGVFSNIRSGFTAGNSGGSGTREGIAMGLAGRDYLNTVGDVSANIANQGYNSGLNFMSNTMGLAPSLYNLGQAPALTEAGVGQQKEQQEAAVRDWMLNAPWMGLQNYANIVYGGSNPITKSTGGGGNELMQMAGLAMMAGSLMSDRRMKSNIVRIGTHPELGVGIYEYNIFGRREVGMMAQEVFEVKPEAVQELHGFLFLNYGRL